ncbi:hypothetical protein [uncultured Helicobacter sp.]|uniref:hypothetical protein n=1 Tax=uncultured Helicobacter sp. TaxID=175537 RepID=UPI001C3A40DE|nr:hypothetical protein [Candidatus Helicobacter avicola]
MSDKCGSGTKVLRLHTPKYAPSHFCLQPTFLISNLRMPGQALMRFYKDGRFCNCLESKAFLDSESACKSYQSLPSEILGLLKKLRFVRKI